MAPQPAAHVTASVAANCWVAPSLTAGFSGEIDHVRGASTVSEPYTLYLVPLAATA